MRLTLTKERGRPIYVPATRGTISFVPEVRVIEAALGASPRLRFRRVSPYAIYVIDNDGVERVRVRDRGALIAALFLATGLLLVLPFVLWSARKDNGWLARGR